MRVLMTTDTVGGVWTFSKELAAGLLQRGHAVALVSLGRAPSPEQLTWCSRVTEKYAERFLYESSCAPLEWMNSNDTAYAEAEPLLLRVAERFVPNLLHSNQFCSGRLPLELPKIVTAHSDVFSWAAACRPNGLQPSPWLDQYRSLVETGLEGVDAMVAPTRSTLYAMATHFSVLPPSHVILNGRSLPAVTEEEPRKLQAVSVGRLWDEAKHIALLEEVQAPFPIFAVGEQRYEEAAAPEHSGCFELIEPLAEDELLRLFRQSSIYLATSIYEPFGLAPLEAALCGCAIVANDILSLREVWGEGAIYFQGSAEMTQLLHTLQASPDTLRDARQRSYERALQLSGGRMTEAYVALYEELLGSSRLLPAQELTSLAC